KPRCLQIRKRSSSGRSSSGVFLRRRLISSLTASCRAIVRISATRESQAESGKFRIAERIFEPPVPTAAACDRRSSPSLKKKFGCPCRTPLSTNATCQQEKTEKLRRKRADRMQRSVRKGKHTVERGERSRT